MPRCLPLRGAWTRRFRAILEICAMARSLPHNCFASCSKVFPGKAEATATLFAALAALAAISALATATSRSSSTTTYMLLSQRCSCELAPPPHIRCPACCRSRCFIPLCPQVSAWVDHGRREWRRERQRERQREQQQQRLSRADVASRCGEQSRRADVVSRSWRAARPSGVPRRRAEQMRDVPSRRAEYMCRADAQSRSRQWGCAERVAACWLRRAGRGEQVAESRSRRPESGWRRSGFATTGSR